jgi:O-antigen ligase
VLITIYVLAILFKIALSIKHKTFKVSPLFFGFLAFVCALMLNGAFSEEYKALDFVYGLFLAFLFLGIFVLMCGNIKVTSRTFESIALSFVALTVLLIIELAVKYATTEGIVVNGVINKSAIVFGWGVHNTMGMLFSISIPSILYLAGIYKWGWLFTLYSFVVYIAIFFTMSRQAMVGGSIIFVCSSLMLIIKGKNRIVNSSVFAVAAIAVATLLIVRWDKISDLFANVLHNLTNTSGRTELYATALENFKKYPIFGIGFFINLANDPGWAGLDIIPLMYHNTFMQLLGACGGLGLLTYAIHRTQTVICYIKNITVERTYIAFTILALLIVNLFDNHLFYLLPTILYGCLVAVLKSSEKGA